MQKWLQQCCCRASHLGCPLWALAVALQEAASILGQSLDHLQSGKILLVMQDAHAPLLQHRWHREHVPQAAVPRHRRLTNHCLSTRQNNRTPACELSLLLKMSKRRWAAQKWGSVQFVFLCLLFRWITESSVPAAEAKPCSCMNGQLSSREAHSDKTSSVGLQVSLCVWLFWEWMTYSLSLSFPCFLPLGRGLSELGTQRVQETSGEPESPKKEVSKSPESRRASRFRIGQGTLHLKVKHLLGWRCVTCVRKFKVIQAQALNHTSLFCFQSHTVSEYQASKCKWSAQMSQNCYNIL